MSHHRRIASVLIVVAFFITTQPGCSSVVQAVGIQMFYKKNELPASQIIRDLSYWQGPDIVPQKHKLDLFVPAGSGWPVLIFVHGGGWTSGDKRLEVANADIYENIGRYFAAHGVGVAVINYRLLPQVSWQDQVMDVARATAWVHHHISQYRGDPRALFISGHSAGAQLAVRVALDPAQLGALSLSPKIIRGVIAVSGAAYDLTDEETFEFGREQGVYDKIFASGVPPPGWRKKASPIRFVNADAPPFLILYGEKEEKELQHESQKLHNALVAVGAHSQLVSVPKETHGRMALALSHPKKITTLSMRVFIAAHPCR